MWCNIAINRSNTAVKRRRTSGRQVLSSSHNEFFAKEFNQPHRSFKPRYFKTAPLCCKTQNKMWNPQDTPCLIISFALKSLEFFPFLILISIYKFLWLIQFLRIFCATMVVSSAFVWNSAREIDASPIEPLAHAWHLTVVFIWTGR